jgi:hypothetical protein
MPEGLFKRLVMRPIPSGVNILHGYSDGIGDEAVYLHFKISPSDLDSFIRNHKFSKEPCCGFHFDDTPSWWKPKGTQYRISSERYGCDRETGMWVSADKTEVYYFNIFF